MSSWAGEHVLSPTGRWKILRRASRGGGLAGAPDSSGGPRRLCLRLGHCVVLPEMSVQGGLQFPVQSLPIARACVRMAEVCPSDVTSRPRVGCLCRAGSPLPGRAEWRTPRCRCASSGRLCLARPRPPVLRVGSEGCPVASRTSVRWAPCHGAGGPWGTVPCDTRGRRGLRGLPGQPPKPLHSQSCWSGLRGPGGPEPSSSEAAALHWGSWGPPASLSIAS